MCRLNTYPLPFYVLIAVDHLYWTDAITHKLFRCDLNGTGRIVYHEDTNRLSDVRLVGDYLYYVTLDSTLVLTFKFTFKYQQIIYFKNIFSQK